MSPPILFHSNLFSGYAKEVATKYNFQWISWNRCACRAFLAALHFSGYVLVGYCPFDSLPNLPNVIHWISIIYFVITPQCYFHVSTYIFVYAGSSLSSKAD